MAPFTEGSFDHVPSEIREFFSVLAFDVTWLNAKWKIYRQLFVSGNDVLDLLNSTAPSFFRILQDALKADIFLSISRLLDPPSTMGRKNASFDRLVEHLGSAGHDEAGAALRPIVDQMRATCEQILKRRNRILAHRDLPSALRLDMEALRIIDPGTIGEAIALAGGALNKVEALLSDRSTAFQGITLHDDANHLLALLRQVRTS
jgi:hypothetical protein